MQETQAQLVSQRRRRIHFGESELRETNPCVSLWFGSLLISLAFTLCFRFDLLGCVVFACAGTRDIFDITYRDTTPSYIYARAKEGRNSDFGQVLHRTGLTGPHNRSDRPIHTTGLTGCPLYSVVKSLTGLTDMCTNLCFKCWNLQKF